jgi:hypothetical protein
MAEELVMAQNRYLCFALSHLGVDTVGELRLRSQVPISKPSQQT